MSINFRCPHCGKSYSLEDKFAGKKAKCKCGVVIRIPRPSNPATQQQSSTHEESRSQTGSRETRAFFDSDFYLLRRFTASARILSSNLSEGLDYRLFEEVRDGETKRCIAIVQERSRGFWSNVAGCCLTVVGGGFYLISGLSPFHVEVMSPKDGKPIYVIVRGRHLVLSHTEVYCSNRIVGCYADSLRKWGTTISDEEDNVLCSYRTKWDGVKGFIYQSDGSEIMTLHPARLDWNVHEWELRVSNSCPRAGFLRDLIVLAGILFKKNV